MRHNRRTRRLGRTWSERKALLKGLVTNLLHYQAIRTTLPKAKEAKRLADRVITLGKEDTLHARRQVFSYLQDHALTSRVFKEIAPRFKERHGGYTRVLHLPERRKGDGAELALLELTEKVMKPAAPSKIKEKKEERPAPHEGHAHAAPPSEKPETPPKRPEVKKEKEKKGFFRNLSRFFRNKGGGG